MQGFEEQEASDYNHLTEQTIEPMGITGAFPAGANRESDTGEQGLHTI
jgi:hypothetical protein